MKIISWNVNSVRARIDNILDYIKEANPDILLFQEIKTQDENFPYDIFKLDYNKISKLEGWGRLSLENLKYSINQKKNISLERLIFALGIRHIGLENAKLLSKYFNTFQNFKNLSKTNKFNDLLTRGLESSPIHEVLIDKALMGWKEYELELLRDKNNNIVIICTIENMDPMGIHTCLLYTSPSPRD